jgi:hypothetical protein
MTRVLGRLFEDDRNGVVAIKPSKPFFGADKYERHYPVKNGAIDIELTATPPGIYYEVGYKEEGDIRDTVYTLKWRIPNQEELDLSPKDDNQRNEGAETEQADTFCKLQAMRLAEEVSVLLAEIQKFKDSVEAMEEDKEELEAKVTRLEQAHERAMQLKDTELEALRETKKPLTKTIKEYVPVADQALLERIRNLEAQNKELQQLNSEYYKSVVELYQLKLDRAPTAPTSPAVGEGQLTPHQRLINQLAAK